MKASLKFREERNPLLRAKVPLNILGLPFQSGIISGESKELSLNLSTFFQSGPSVKISYRPNDTWNPFSLVIKTGTGHFGSPVSSSMIMSAEFNLLSKGDSNLKPIFMLHFKPQFGDFSIKKSQSSTHVSHLMGSIKNGGASSDVDDGSIEAATPTLGVVNGVFCGKRITVSPPVMASAVAGVFSGVEIAAKTRLPVRSKAVVSFRWGVRVPADIKSGGGGGASTTGINFRKIPCFVMNKIGIEQGDGRDERSKKEGTAEKAGMDLGNAEVAEACLGVKRQLEVLQSENGHLKKAVEELSEEMKLLGGDLKPGKYERNGIKSPE
ncbi:hypothetical protein OIU76_021352 [Salix suchowensis]|nr:hypothetical protein OIU76_021352 [Salix suchowensis]